MTFFCTAVTGIILAVLTLICLMTAENSIKKSSFASFSNETASMITYLQEQNTISLSWINALREKNGFELVLYDNGCPLFSHTLCAPSDELIRLAADTAAEQFGVDLFRPCKSLTESVLFSLPRNGGYNVCAGKIAKKQGQLSFLIFSSLQQQQTKILRQRMIFTAAACAALVLLAAFSWFFTGRMLLPLEENHRKQAEFIAAASHELRTPLAVVLSASEAIEKSDHPAEQLHFTNMIRTEIGRMQHLISDMLLLANSDADALRISLTSCQPDELLLSVYETYELQARRKQISLHMALPDGVLPDIRCDKDRLFQVLAILMDNALSYTPPGGTVTLSLAAAKDVFPADSARQDRGNRMRSDSVIFQVSDTGCGISAEELDRIFDRFYRCESSRTDKEHFGLGLTIAKELVTAQNGTLSVKSVPNRGTCFSVGMPVIS